MESTCERGSTAKCGVHFRALQRNGPRNHHRDARKGNASKLATGVGILGLMAVSGQSKTIDRIFVARAVFPSRSPVRLDPRE